MYYKFSYYFLLIFILFFATNPCHSIIHTTEPQCLETERNALLELKHNLQYLSFSWPLSWTGSNCCTWKHIVCNNISGNIIELDLSYVLSNDTALDGNILLPLLSLDKLAYLDISNNNFSDSLIPAFIGSFKSLEYLDVSYSFRGRIPDELGNLSNLQSLNIECFYCYIENIDWLSQLKSLRNLDLRYVDMSKASGWLQALNSLTHIIELDLFRCSLSSLPPLQQVNFTSLTTIDLSFNNLNSSFPDWIYKLKNLSFFDVSYNSLYGSLPATIGNLSLLEYLSVQNNNLSGQIPESIGQLQSLVEFYMSNNNFNGPIPQSIGKLSRLESFFLHTNSLNGIITESHFTNMSRLTVLDMAINLMVFKISDNWVPPFQIQFLYLDFCLVGPKFPSWIRTQHSLMFLSLENGGIKNPVPNWFANFSSSLRIIYLSNNNISGELSPFFNPNINVLVLSNSSFSGPIPSEFGEKMTSLNYLDLSSNNFDGSIPSSFCEMEALSSLSLSNNRLSGELPDCWKSSTPLHFIQISNNNLYGRIPQTFCNLSELLSLQLNHNMLSGLIPSCLENCTSLVELDLGYNNLAGNIPSWNKNSNLSIISLTFNELTGRIPDLSQLRYLQVLDLSNNNLLGHIPSSLGNLSAMTAKISNHSKQLVYAADLWLLTKGSELEFPLNLLPFLKLIDLSENNLIGHIPDELMKLYGVQTLNLSGNRLTGQIPTDMGRLQQLETLDLSRNNLSGIIPASFETLSFLDHLNLSYNNLSGNIPTGEQLQTLDDPSIYEGNPFLCGIPLKKLCQLDGNQQHGKDQEHKDINEEEFIWFYISIIPGFVVGFWLVNGILILQQNWRIAYFQAIDKVYCMIIERIL